MTQSGGKVNADLAALLIVQDDDTAIRELEAQRTALAPRLAALDQARRSATEELARTEAALATERERHRALDARLTQHRAHHARTVDILNHAQKLKEATAAAAQMEAARRTLADEEREALALSRRVSDLHTAVAAHREAVATLVTDQESVRAALAGERESLEAGLAAAREQRARSASMVSRGLLSTYERIHARRRTTVVVPVQANYTCGACDTAIPLQRRPALASGGVVEPCEGCGVLLYYRPATSA